MHPKDADGMETVQTLISLPCRSSLIWVCTVCLDLLVPILGIFTVHIHDDEYSKNLYLYTTHFFEFGQVLWSSKMENSLNRQLNTKDKVLTLNQEQSDLE